jgi:hypothetical protein
MFEIDFELSKNAKTIMSWMICAELLKLVDNQRAILITYPFDGHYDCLTLSNPDEKHQILLNRLGENALAEDELVESIWARAAYSPRETALHIMSESQIPAGEGADFNLGAIKGATRIAQFLSEDMNGTADAIWGFGDESHDLLAEFLIPEGWKNFPSPTSSTSWSAWLWILTRKGSPEAVVNLSTGEILKKSGEPWRGFRNKALVDEEGLPTSTVAVSLEMLGSGNTKPWNVIARPAFAHGTYRMFEEEGETVTVRPLRSLDSLDDVRSVWAEPPSVD